MTRARYSPSRDRAESLAFILALVGLVVAVLGIRDVIRTLRPAGWPTTQGRVLSTQVRRDSASFINWYSNTTARWDRFFLRYSYSVGGQQYYGNRIDGLSSTDGSPYALRNQERYAAGAAVTVRYNPRDPSDAVLETPIPLGAAVRTVLATIVVGLCMIPFLSRSRGWRPIP